MDGRGMLLAAGSGAVYAVYISGVEHSGLKELPVLLEPVTGVLIGALIFQEKITVRSAIGMILILLSVLLLTLADSKGVFFIPLSDEPDL